MKNHIRLLTAFLLLLTSSIPVWADDKDDIEIGTIGDGSATVVACDNNLPGACEAILVRIEVTPGTNSITNIGLITATDTLGTTTYKLYSDGTYYSYDPADVTGKYGTKRTIDLYLYNDTGMGNPAPDNLKITVKFISGIELRSDLKNATVTFFDGGTTKPDANFTFPADGITEISGNDHWIIAHIVPANTHWTDASLIKALETGGRLARSNAPGLAGGNTLELLKRDTYKDDKDIEHERYDGAGWYCYSIPSEHTLGNGYNASVLKGYVVTKFDFDDMIYQDPETMAITVSRQAGSADETWSAVISFEPTSLSVPFDTYDHDPVISNITVKNKGKDVLTLASDFDKQMTVKGGKTIGCNMTLTADTCSFFINDDDGHYFDIYVPFKTDNNTGIKGSEENPWLITTPAELSLLAKCVNIGNYHFEGRYLELRPEGGADGIDMKDVTDFEPIGICSSSGPIDHMWPFAGVFDGNSKTISNLSYTDDATLGDNDDWSIGLFGNLNFRGAVKNVTLSGCTFTGSAKSTKIGGIAGRLGGSSAISGCTISDCTLKGIGDDDFIGGIAGEVEANSDMQGKLTGNRVKGTTAGGTTISGSATSYIGAIFGFQMDFSYNNLNNNKYNYNVKVERGNTAASAYTLRGYWKKDYDDDTKSAWADINDASEGAMLEAYPATLTVEPAASGSTVTFTQVTEGTDCYKVDGTTYYYSPGDEIVLSVNPGTRVDDIRTFNEELTAMTVNVSTDGVTLATPSFIMPETAAAVVATFSNADWFTIPTNNKKWMTFYHEWESSSNPANYDVTDATATPGKTIEVLTVSDVNGTAGTITTANLSGVSYSSVPTLFHCEETLPATLKFTPNTTATNTAATAGAFKGVTTATPVSGDGIYVMNGLGDFLWAYDTTAPIGAHKCYIDLGSATTARLTIVGDSEATGISTTHALPTKDEVDGWYTIDGRRLRGVPTTKGLYIYKGIKTVIK